MSKVMGTVRSLRDPSVVRVPISHEFPRAGIVRRLLTGIALLVAAGALSLLGGMFWPIAGVLAAVGGIVSAGNLRALLDADWRRITIDQGGIVIRYGFSSRQYGLLEYSEYYISTLGERHFLTALPVEIDTTKGSPAQRIRATVFDRPAIITPMPPLGDGSPTSLSEWRSLLNSLRQKAIASAGVSSQMSFGGKMTMAAGDSLPCNWQRNFH